jgi:hypothetical protein
MTSALPMRSMNRNVVEFMRFMLIPATSSLRNWITTVEVTCKCRMRCCLYVTGSKEERLDLAPGKSTKDRTDAMTIEGCWNVEQ